MNVMLDRHSSGVRKRHQWPVTKAHKAENDRERDAAQCDSGSVRAHENYLVTVRWVASPAHLVKQRDNLDPQNPALS